MFIRTKSQGDKTYHYLVQNYQQDGKIKQEVLCYLGRSDNFKDSIREVERQLGQYHTRRLKRQQALRSGKYVPEAERARLQKDVRLCDRMLSKLEQRLYKLKKYQGVIEDEQKSMAI